MKVFAVLLIISVLGSGAYQVISLVQDKARFEAGMNTAITENELKDQALARMGELYAESQQVVATQNKRYSLINRKLSTVSQELRNEKKLNLTPVEYECSHSDIPGSILSILHETPSGSDESDSTNKGMPSFGTILKRGLASLHRKELDRSGGVHQDAASRVFEISFRSHSGTGIL